MQMEAIAWKDKTR